MKSSQNTKKKPSKKKPSDEEITHRIHNITKKLKERMNDTTTATKEVVDDETKKTVVSMETANRWTREGKYARAVEAYGQILQKMYVPTAYIYAISTLSVLSSNCFF